MKIEEEVEVLNRLIAVLSPLPEDQRLRVFAASVILLGLTPDSAALAVVAAFKRDAQ